MQSQSPATDDYELQPTRKPFFQFWRFFWLSFLVISLGYAWHCFYVPSNRVAWAENYASAQTQASQTEKPVLLFFTGEWCVPCRIMKRKVWADEQVAESVNASFIPVTIDVNNPEDAAVLARYNIGGSPVTMVTDPDGNVLRWREGGLEKSEFLEFLEASNSLEAENS